MIAGQRQSPRATSALQCIAHQTAGWGRGRVRLRKRTEEEFREMRQPFAFGETTAARECCSGSLGLNVSTQPDTRPSREGRPRQPPLRLTLRRVSSRRPALGKIEPVHLKASRGMNVRPPSGHQRTLAKAVPVHQTNGRTARRHAHSGRRTVRNRWPAGATTSETLKLFLQVLGGRSPLSRPHQPPRATDAPALDAPSGHL